MAERNLTLLKLIAGSLLIFAVAFGQATLTTAQIAKRVSPSVVTIEGKTASGDVLGSGFIVSKDGKLVTNLHVIRDMKTASIHLANGEIFDSVSVLATDERRDLAIIGVAGYNLPILDLGNSDSVTLGEPVVIVGSPRGLEGTVTAGILSSVRDSGEGFKVLQTDAAVNPGNSGGSLVNRKGEAIGVVSFKLSSSEGLNFAIPINYVRGLLNNLQEPLTLDQMRNRLVASATSQSDVPSLKETLDWLKEKIPLGTVHFLHSIRGEPEFVYSVNRQSMVWSMESCSAEIGEVTTATPVSTASRGGNPDPFVITVHYTVPLGILTGGYVLHDEATVAGFTFVSGEQWGYYVWLTGSSEIVVTSSSDNPKHLSDSSVTDHLFLIFSDESLAQRVLHAFNHAAAFCRRKEPF